MNEILVKKKIEKEKINVIKKEPVEKKEINPAQVPPTYLVRAPFTRRRHERRRASRRVRDAGEGRRARAVYARRAHGVQERVKGLVGALEKRAHHQRLHRLVGGARRQALIFFY